MSRPLALAALSIFIALTASALAQTTTVPGPGGIPLAPGSPVPGYTPGGIGPGGVEVAPGPAARAVPMYREGPGGVVFPLRPDPAPNGNDSTGRLQPVPELLPQTLALTITSRDAAPGKAPPPEVPIDSIHDLFEVLRTCWEPPARDEAQEGVQMSVRFSFKRTGEMMAPPFVTYTTPGTNADTKQVYRRAIDASLARCAPLPLSKSFSTAIAGRPISIRYVDDRSMKASLPQP